jgi:DNA-binding NtrC family response regulator
VKDVLDGLAWTYTLGRNGTHDAFGYFHAEVTAMTAAKFILVADDDEPSREGLKLLLSRWGYAAETAIDGADALHHAVTRHPALIITDLHMPKMDGLELLRTVQASLPDVPAIVVTGTLEGSRTRTEAGRLAFGYLRKPVDVTRLKGLVKAAMEPGSRSGGSA